MTHQTTEIRNVALTGHASAGKTTLVEQMLVTAGAIRSAGAVEKGSTVSDWDDLEKKHGHSLSSSLAGFDYQGTHINLLDTPGYPDFVGTALSVLPAVETVAVVINHIDSPEVDLESIYLEVQEAFGKECLAVNLPSADDSGVIDCFFRTEGDPAFSSVEAAHTEIVDQTVEVDEALMATYLDQGEVAADQLHDAFEQAMREGHLIPVLSLIHI